jgi:diadenosine tetraphosphate (Ap4A) HIT family hydrolase
MSSAWSLHPQLETDTLPIGDLPLSRLLVSKDATYPWLILVPRFPGAVEIIDLDKTGQANLMAEIGRAAGALKDLTRCHKLNVAALGNQVPQLHVHIVARFTTDPAWPRPIWGEAAPQDHDPGTLRTFIDALRAKLDLPRS